GGGAVGIGVCRPCGERGRQLRGVHAAGRAGAAALPRLQGRRLRGRGRVAAVLLLVVGRGRAGEDRRGGAWRVQGGQHAVLHQAAPGGHLRHAVHAALPARQRRRVVPADLLPAPGEGEAVGVGHHAHRALRHRADPAWQGRWRRGRRAQAVPFAALVRLPLRQLQPCRRRPPLRPRRGTPRWRCHGGGRAVHPRVHIVVRVLDGDGAAAREPGGAGAAAAVRGGPPRVRAQPQAGGLAVHAPGARGDDRALRHRAVQGRGVPHRRALARLHPRARARRQVPRRRQVHHPRRAGTQRPSQRPYFPVPKGEMGTQYVLRAVAPRRVWPAIAFGASVACWYEHLGRTVSIVLCKHHRLWELAFRVFTLYRVRTYLMDGFFCHTHIASWHTLHNIICGSAGKIDKCLEAVRDQLTCGVTIYHGGDDELLPVGCSYAVQSKIPRATVKVIDGKDHVTIVVQRQKELARELEEIWDTKR
uniref:AB hydrolase-1 domain-containing protein n=2 Tax=Aegilops tauschii subsp. strangulata TaxID=200361 RepID=A0A452YP80_AEGTS